MGCNFSFGTNESSEQNTDRTPWEGHARSRASDARQVVQPPAPRQQQQQQRWKVYDMGNSVNKHIEHAQRTGTCQLSELGLSEFPPSLFSLNNLRTLEANQNKFKIIPDKIGQFSQLRKLALSFNQIQRIPTELCRLMKLESLRMNNNLLAALPQSFGDLRALREVNLSANRLTLFPETLCALTKLDSLDLSKNKITEIPDFISGLQAVELNLNENRLCQISESIVDCKRLKVLRVEENCLQLTAFTPRLLKESSFNMLCFDGNLFESKKLHLCDGYDEYMERFAASRRKMG